MLFLLGSMGVVEMMSGGGALILVGILLAIVGVIAFAIFMLIKVINKVKAKEPAAAAAPSSQEVLLTEIRDLLRDKK